MTIVENIFLGVTSGVLTAAVLYLIAILVKKHVIPWYQAVTYRGIDVSGMWVAEVENEGSKARLEMNLFQHAHKLYGTTTIVQGRDLSKPAVISNMNLSGSIWEGYMTLNMQSSDRKRLSYSTTLLEVKNGGAILNGNLLYRSIQSDQIRTSAIVWSRKK